MAQRFRVSLGYVEKIRGQQLQSGKMERIPHQPGRKAKLNETIRGQLGSWLKQQPDLTLAELQEKLGREKQLRVSVPSLWVVLRKMGLRLKKSRSTRGSETQKPTSRSGKRFWNKSARSRSKS